MGQWDALNCDNPGENTGLVSKTPGVRLCKEAVKESIKVAAPRASDRIAIKDEAMPLRGAITRQRMNIAFSSTGVCDMGVGVVGWK